MNFAKFLKDVLNRTSVKPTTLFKNETLAQVFTSQFLEISQNTFSFLSGGCVWNCLTFQKIFKLLHYLDLRRKKKCVRFLVGADGETREVPEKDQVDHSDSDDNSSVQVKTETINDKDSRQVELSNDIKEKFQELVNNTTSDIQVVSSSGNVSELESQTTDAMMTKISNNNNDIESKVPSLINTQSALCTSQASQVNKNYTDFKLQTSVSAMNPSRLPSSRNSVPQHYQNNTSIYSSTHTASYSSDNKTTIQQQNLEASLKTVTATCSQCRDSDY